MITFEEVSKLVSYNPETGLFQWIAAQRGRRNNEAGTNTIFGYRQLCLNFKRYRAHRIAWLLIYGDWPKGDLDHINGIRDDNRLCNLRECTRSGNQQNQKRSKANSSGAKGVYWNKDNQKWHVQIRANRKLNHFGFFADKDEAIKIAIAAREQLHGEFANHG